MSVAEKLCVWLAKHLPSTTITLEGKSYLTRCYVFGKDRKWGNIYLHHFHASDPAGDELHNHPWEWGVSLILAGGYVEELARDVYLFSHQQSNDDKQVFGNNGVFDNDQCQGLDVEQRLVIPGSLNFIKQSSFHRVDLLDEQRGAWTLFFAGPRTKDWGFLDRKTTKFTGWRSHPGAIP